MLKTYRSALVMKKTVRLNMSLATPILTGTTLSDSNANLVESAVYWMKVSFALFAPSLMKAALDILENVCQACGIGTPRFLLLPCSHRVCCELGRGVQQCPDPECNRPIGLVRDLQHNVWKIWFKWLEESSRSKDLEWRGIRPHLENSPNAFWWGCKFADVESIMAEMQYNLLWKLYDVLASLIRSRHLISNIKYNTKFAKLFASAETRFHE